VLLRPDDTVQIGWDPQRAVLVHPPVGLTAAALASVLRSVQSATLEDVAAAAARHGSVRAAELTALLDALVGVHVINVSTRREQQRAVSIRVHGRGPLSDLLVEALRCSGSRIKHSSQPHAGVNRETTDLVVLSDNLVTDPRLVRDLHEAGIAHLPVRVRDRVGLVGPLVIPGKTSCLACADLHRSDRDAAWPAVAAQLRDTVGSADRATVLATAALALSQVDRVVRAIRDGGEPGPPATLNTTLEFDLGATTIATRRWPRHPRCHC
jgi:bacteriocin biosynthesis cyclodehydratase domain-containing protein